MLNHISIKFAQRQQVRLTTGIRFLSIMFFLSCIAVPTVFGQCNESPTSYSDLWLWSTSGTNSNGDVVYDEENPSVTYIAGTGHIQDPYNSCGHEYYVDSTEIQSPSGRIATGSDYAELVFDENDLGNYSVSNNYLQFCPIIYRFYSAGSSNATLLIGSSFNSYRKGAEVGPTIGYYYQIPNCNTTCRSDSVEFRVRQPPLPPFLRVAEPYAITIFGRICSPLTAVMRANQAYACVDVGF
jgi:hypothetical protein